MAKIHSIIEISYTGCEGDCEMPKKLRKHSKNPDWNQGNPHEHHYKSEAKSDKNRFFHNVKHANAGVNQNVSVNVQVQKEDDCLTSCFAGLAKCFGR